MTKQNVATKLLAAPAACQLTKTIMMPPKRGIAAMTPTLAFQKRTPALVTDGLPPLPPNKRYVATTTKGWVSRIAGQHLTEGTPIEVELPLGTPRFVTAKALIGLLGGGRSEKLLKWDGQQWNICEPNQRVDLTDTATQYRVGAVAVYS